MRVVLTVCILTFLEFVCWSQQTHETININDVNREYYQYLPTGYDAQTEELPVVFILHGLGGTAQNTSTYGWNAIADTARYIAIYPQGLLNQYNQTAWNNGTLLASDGEDLAFISQLIDSLNADTDISIDLSRVYMTGISMGAIMTYRVSRYMSDRIAAVVCHIGTMSDIDLTNYNPAYPVPTLHKHGTEDQTVPYDTNKLASLSLVPQTIDQLKIINGWNGDSTVTTIPDNGSDNITVDRIVYNCSTPLELWRMNDADHILLFEAFGSDTNSTEVTWGFLQQFTHANPSAASVKELQVKTAKVFPNPTNGILNVVNYFDFETVAIYSVEGKFIERRKTKSSFDLSHLDKGLYLLKFTDKNQIVSTQKIMIQ